MKIKGKIKTYLPFPQDRNIGSLNEHSIERIGGSTEKFVVIA
jgi:hypothetical protein